MTPTPTILCGSMGPNSQSIDTALDQAVGKQQSLAHLAQSWAYGRKADGSPAYAAFPSVMLQSAWDKGVLVLLDWASWDLQNQSDPSFDLDTITAGAHDQYLRSWAKAAASWAHPFIIRFDAEFNGNWWRYGNRPAAFVAAWRYMVDIFRSEGATNVAWHWCPNVCAPAGSTFPTSTDKLAAYYPGDTYVDWTGMDTYNWFTGKRSSWMTFAEIVNGYPGTLGPTYDTLLKIAPTKPILLGEFNCWDDPRKPLWFIDALSVIPLRFPAIRGISLFNWAADTSKWPLNAAALAGWRQGIASPIYLAAGDWTPPDLAPLGPPPLTVQLLDPNAVTAQTAALTAQAALLAAAKVQLADITVTSDAALATLASIKAHLAALLQAAQ